MSAETKTTRPAGRPTDVKKPEVRFRDAEVKAELAAVAKAHGDTVNRVAVTVLRTVDIGAEYQKGIQQE